MSLRYIDHLKTQNKRRRYLLIYIVFGLCYLIVLSPILLQLPEVDIFYLRKSFSLICHQRLDRFLSFNGFYPFICARDMGIYLMIFIGLYFPLYRYKRFLVGFVLLFIVEKVLEHGFDFTVTNTIRFLVGLGIGLFIVSLTQHVIKFGFFYKKKSDTPYRSTS